MPLFKKSSPIPPAPPPPPLPGTQAYSSSESSESNTVEPDISTSLENKLEVEEKTVAKDVALEVDCSENETVKKDTSKKQKPAPPSKSSRLQKALSSGSLTLPSFRRKSLKGSKKKQHKRLSTTDVLPEEINDQNVSPTAESGGQLRDTPLWKLPGMGLKKDRRSSSPSLTHTPITAIKSNSHTPQKDEATKSIEELLKRDLPPLPQSDETELEVSNEVNTSLSDGQTSKHDNSESALKMRELPLLPPEDVAADDKPPPRPVTPVDNNLPPPRPATPAMSEKSSNTSEGLTVSSENLCENETKQEDANEVQDNKPAPPPLPDRPADLTPPSSRKISQVNPSEMALRDAINKYVGCFPLRIRVLQGYCSDVTDVNISTDDVYDIHFIKETKVVSVKSENGMTYRIPLGSRQKVGLIYNPSSDYEKGLNGHTFKTISEVSSSPVLPKVICATQEARSSDGKYLVEENEILVVRQVHRTLFKGKKGLKVYSMLLKTEKTLPDDCNGYFSTKPSLVRMHLPEIIEYVPKPFPALAVMYSAGENTQSSDQQGDITGVVTITDYSTETSLVASAVTNDDSFDGEQDTSMDVTEPDSSEVFDIPLDDEMRDLEISVVRVSPKNIEEASDSDDSDHVYDDTVNIVKDQDFVSNTSSSHLNTSTGHLNTSNSHLNTSTGYLNKSTGHLSTSNVLLSELPQLPASSSTYRRLTDSERPVSMHFPMKVQDDEYTEEDELAGYDTVGLHLLNPQRNQSSASTSKYDDMFDRSDPRLTNWVEDLQSTTKAIEGRLMSLESDKNSAEMTRMQDMLLQLTRKLESVDTQIQSITSPPQPSTPDLTSDSHLQKAEETETQPAEDNKSPEEMNRTYLSTLSIDEVCELMDAMSLGRYKEHIQKELVSGDILVEFDDDILKEELCIPSKIQRIRLMKVISGQHSAKDILKK